MRIYVVRHGEAEDDIEDAYGGCADFRLTDRGRQQAVEAAAGLSDASIDAIFSSPLVRASETAEILATELGGALDVRIRPGLRERNSYGVLSGISKARAKELFAHVLSELTEKPGYSREPLLGAENFDAFVQRVRESFDLVVDESRAQGWSRIVIVTHGKFTQALCEFVFKFGAVDLDLSATLCVDYEPALASLA